MRCIAEGYQRFRQYTLTNNVEGVLYRFQIFYIDFDINSSMIFFAKDLTFVICLVLINSIYKHSFSPGFIRFYIQSILQLLIRINRGNKKLCSRLKPVIADSVCNFSRNTRGGYSQRCLHDRQYTSKYPNDEISFCFVLK